MSDLVDEHAGPVFDGERWTVPASSTAPAQPTTFPLTPEGVSEALRSLDVESWEIAALLRTAGVTGIQANECECPIARRVRQLVPAASDVFVEAEWIRVTGVERDSWGFDLTVTTTVRLPDGAQDFVQEFDLGEHPELIEEVKNDA